MTTSLISPQEAAEELLRRRKARTKFIEFVKYVYPGYRADPMHELIASTLDEVIEGRIKRLIISAPPQHGKSLLLSELLPPYSLGRHPNNPVIIASYAAKLAHTKSRSARTIVESDRYQALFGKLGPHDVEPVTTSTERRAVDEWQLAAPYRGGLVAMGVDGGLTGFPCALGIIDDPIKGWQDAQSPTVRESTWEWYLSVFRSRLWEGGAIAIVMTRWSEDDMVGRLLKLQGDDWTVLRLPALAETQEERDKGNKYIGLPLGLPDPLGREPGEPVAPQRYSKTALLDIKRDVGSMIWTALYQGVPRAPEGNRFKRHWFPIVDAAPAKGKRVRYWDKAGTQDSDGAATAGLLMLRTEDNRYYIENVTRGWYSSLQRETVIKQTAQLDAQRLLSRSAVKIYVEQEPGSGGKESAESTIRNLTGFSIHADRPTGDKDTRLEPFAAQAEAGNVFLVRGAWNEDFIEEMVAIPNGTRRDQGDAAAGAFNKLNDRQEGGKTVPVSGLYGRKRG